ncbi:hypothetical protein [Victivallis vadensis]|uniref:hypothetical protein n=1 Tax=Victivallis vadensis TaxID=172901 RepID=UPI00266DAE1C|nr:hypothetical protein [Victivallis vadensis]
MSQRELISFLPPNHLNGTDRRGASQGFQLNFRPEPEQQELGGFRICRYRLTEFDGAPPPDSIILLLLRPVQLEALLEYVQEIYRAYPEALNLNPWLTPPVTSYDRVYRGSTLIFRCDDPARLDWIQLHNRVPGVFGLYRVTPAGGKNQK